MNKEPHLPYTTGLDVDFVDAPNSALGETQPENSSDPLFLPTYM